MIYKRQMCSASHGSPIQRRKSVERCEVLLFSQFSPVLWLVQHVGSDLTYWAFSLPSPNLRIAFPTSITPSRRSPRPCVTAATLGESCPWSSTDACILTPVLYWAALKVCVQSLFQHFSLLAWCLPFYLNRAGADRNIWWAWNLIVSRIRFNNCKGVRMNTRSDA